VDFFLYIIVAAFWGGLLVGLPVLYFRAGLGRIKRSEGIDWREFLIPNIGFFLLMVGKAILWPVTVVHWNLQGRPTSPWVAVTSLNGRSVRRIVRSESLGIRPAEDR
jgi:hypothetical protein